jgi:hypothetical protein
MLATTRWAHEREALSGPAAGGWSARRKGRIGRIKGCDEPSATDRIKADRTPEVKDYGHSAAGARSAGCASGVSSGS